MTLSAALRWSHDADRSQGSEPASDDWFYHERGPGARAWLPDDGRPVHGPATQLINGIRLIDLVAAEEGYEAPSEVARRNAERLLRGLYSRYPRHYDVYPTADRQVAIDVAGGVGRGVLFLLESDGGGACFVTIDGRNRRSRYEDASLLPDQFSIEAMRDLEAASLR
jgi:hypothetical protein